MVVVTSTALFPRDHPAHRSPYYSHKESGGVEVHVLRNAYRQTMSPWGKAFAFWQFFRDLIHRARQLNKPDLVYASSTPPSVAEAGWRLAKKWGVPFVFETVDVWPDVPIGMKILKNPLLIAIFQRRVRFLYAQAKAIVALSPGMKEQIRSHGVPTEKIWVIPNGTNTQTFRPSSNPKNEHPVRLVHTGTLGRVNGVHLLLEAAAMLPKDLPPWEIILLGEGSEKPALQRLANSLGLQNIRFLPAIPKEEMPSFLQEAHIGVMTVDSFPVLEHNSANKWYDYLACGLPIVLNYEGWQAEILREYQAGLAAPMGDRTAFTEHLAKLICYPVLRKKMGQQGREVAVARYDRGKLATDLVKLLEELTQP